MLRPSKSLTTRTTSLALNWIQSPLNSYLTMDDQKALSIYGPHLQYNLSTLFTIKFLVSIFSGATAGILGLTNLYGFLLFATSTVFCAVLVTLVKCGGVPWKFVGDGKGLSMKGALGQLLTPGMDNIWGFILTWTLFYGMYYFSILTSSSLTPFRPGVIHGSFLRQASLQFADILPLNRQYMIDSTFIISLYIIAHNHDLFSWWSIVIEMFSLLPRPHIPCAASQLLSNPLTTSKFLLPSLFSRFRATLAPRRVKWPRRQRGTLPIPVGGSLKGTTLSFGDYGIRVKGMGKRVTAKQLQTADLAMRYKVKNIKGAKIHLRVFPDLPVGVKGNETRMGKGKGGFEYWATWFVSFFESVSICPELSDPGFLLEEYCLSCSLPRMRL
jgi:ribosomal protein L16